MKDAVAYVNAMLYDPAYREWYQIDLRREFPRVFFQEVFAWEAGKDRELLDQAATLMGVTTRHTSR